MKKIYIAIVIVFLILSCNGSKTQQGFTIQVLSDKETIHLNDTLQFDISKNNFGSGVKSVIYRINDKELPKIGVKHVLQNVKLGKQKVIAAITTDDGNQYQAEKELTILAENPPKIYSYRIIAEYPHSTSSYTQGLEFIGDTLIESTGQYGSSTLQKWNVFTGEVYKKIDLNKAYFGEGVTVLNGKIYQLTWQKKIGFVYDMNLNKIQNFNYDQSKEGWGLCNDGKVIYKSDGTEKIWLLNPETLAEENYIQLATNTALYSRANELEWANGKNLCQYLSQRRHYDYQPRKRSD